MYVAWLLKESNYDIPSLSIAIKWACKSIMYDN